MSAFDPRSAGAGAAVIFDGKDLHTDRRDIEYVAYTDESMLPAIRQLVSADLSEPYSVFVYRYFIHQWPELCICAYAVNALTRVRGEMIAVIVNKAEDEGGTYRGYIAMLAVSKAYRQQGLGAELSTRGIDRMVRMGCDEIMLEAEQVRSCLCVSICVRVCVLFVACSMALLSCSPAPHPCTYSNPPLLSSCSATRARCGCTRGSASCAMSYSAGTTSTAPPHTASSCGSGGTRPAMAEKEKGKEKGEEQEQEQEEAGGMGMGSTSRKRRRRRRRREGGSAAGADHRCASHERL